MQFIWLLQLNNHVFDQFQTIIGYPNKINKKVLLLKGSPASDCVIHIIVGSYSRLESIFFPSPKSAKPSQNVS